MWDRTWLDQRTEDVLSPDAEVVDAHHHLWSGKPTLADYLMPDFAADVDDGHRVTQTVYVDCGWGFRDDGPEHLKPVGETETVAAVAADSPHPDLAGIVSFADLAADTLAEVLDAHDEAGRGLFRGVRQSAAYDVDASIRRPNPEPAPDLLDSDAFRAGLELLGARGYTFDAFVYHPQIAQLAAAARAVPGTAVVLDHLGAPLSVGRHQGRRQEVLAEWKDSTAELAECPNAYVKIGGLGWAPMGFGFEKAPVPVSSVELARAWDPFISHVLAEFGPERCMAESNFPVDQLTCTYRTLWNALKLGVADLPEVDQHRVLAGTARELYRL